MKKAFTLAEVLITIVIVGLVSILIISFIPNIQKIIRAEKIRTVKYKLTQATEKMAAEDLIGPYENTTAFVNELKKHFKIIKICPASSLSSCWSYNTIKVNENETIDVSFLQTGLQLKMQANEASDYSSPNVGIVTSDGTSMILSYNTKCEHLNPLENYQWSTENNKPVTNATTSCIAAIFEINGAKAPNKIGDDIGLLNTNGPGYSCVYEVNGKCYSQPFIPTPITAEECEKIKDNLGIKRCCYEYCSNGDYWAGAVKQCGGVDKLNSGGNEKTLLNMFTNYGQGQTKDVCFWKNYENTTGEYAQGSYICKYTPDYSFSFGSNNNSFRGNATRYAICELK